ncbi:ABC transporter ATP-binding protein [Actinoalloteichus sp. AHMU CJ021]|uniref:ABC-2 type transport system ATP-binding protein n=1 Tax=Actinoalloteichus caeruleus DSM 43889 TaxID=1120930 RepID=A0ABT1JF70_ACTCY|nr:MULTISPECIES: ABC transporter ATP-binding protein [Actinoalloteichus]AUS77060.1 ABC transporter ATP-binding protein [Actinoalloteichus sp. AHMU CJ021]MCP2330869.1 ABC-2 type transport system ATP-binding protein [Actinoalloteichus caeruleus DSM 43889]
MQAIEVNELHKRYGSTVAVHDVSLSVRQGEIFGILGRNGAGKSTTVECVAGLLRPTSGTVRVLGLDPHRDRDRVRQVLGVQLQSSDLHNALTVRELVRLYRSFYGDGADPDELIDRVGLTSRRDHRFENLSGGQQQRLSVALALVGNPRVALLDELTTGLDPQARRDIWALVEDLRSDGVTVLLVSHLMEEIERLCDRIAIIDAGRIIALDTPAGLVSGAGLGQRVRFQVNGPFDQAVLDRLPEVTSVRVEGGQVTVRGDGDLLQSVSRALVHGNIIATETRLERPNLDDAFLALTGRALNDDATTEDSR